MIGFVIGSNAIATKFEDAVGSAKCVLISEPKDVLSVDTLVVIWLGDGDITDYLVRLMRTAILLDRRVITNARELLPDHLHPRVTNVITLGQVIEALK